MTGLDSGDGACKARMLNAQRRMFNSSLRPRRHSPPGLRPSLAIFIEHGDDDEDENGAGIVGRPFRLPGTGEAPVLQRQLKLRIARALPVERGRAGRFAH